MHRWFSYILLFLSLLPSVLLAQDPYYRIIDATDGLPSNEVYGLFQDSQGFIWISTDDGLCRYDGHTFKRYVSASQSSRAGSNIFEDNQGRIWYENFDGRLYYVAGDTLAALHMEEVTGFVRAGRLGDRLYVPSLNHFVWIYDLRTLKAVGKIAQPKGLVNVGIGRLGDQCYWLFGEGEHIGIDGQGKLLRVPGRFNQTAKTGTMAMDYQGQVMIMDYFHPANGLYVYQNGQLNLLSPLHNNGIMQTHQLSGGRLWICYTRGMEVLEMPSGAPVSQRLYFPDKSISAVLVDREGNHWFGTTNEGLLFVPDFTSQQIRTLPSGLSRIASGEGQLFVGTQDGAILRYQPETAGFATLRRNESRHAIDFLRVDGQQVIDCDPMLHLTHLDGHAIPLPNKAAFKDAQRISPTYLAVNTPGSSGLFRLPVPGVTGPDHWDATAARHPNPLDNKLVDIFMGRGRAVVARAGDTSIFYATSNGLMRLRPHDQRELRYQGRSFYAAQLQADDRHIYALSTAGDAFRITGDSLIQPLPGLPLEPPYLLMRLLDDRLYLLSRRQLLQLDIDGPHPRLLNVISGLQGDRINDIGLHGDRLALATDDGLLLLDPGQKALVLPPRLLITALRISGRPHAPDSLIEVGYEENEIAIHYAILSYRTGGDYPLYYRIQGGGWSKADPESRQLLLARLAPGNYLVEFCLGMPSTDIAAVVRLRILRPFWMEPWFYALLLLVLAGLVAGLLWRRGRRLQARQAMALERLELENSLRLSTLTAIRSQMNPHFFFNALNTIQAFIFSDDKRNAINYLGKFSKLTRMVLEMSEKELVSLAEELQATTLYLELEKSRFGDDFQFQIQLGPGLLPDLVSLPSMIIQPFVENAVKHGLLHQTGSKELRVSFTAQGDTLVIEIDDNGIGRKRSEALNRIRKERHRSFAVEASQKRIDLLNSGYNRIGVTYVDKYDADGLACGTTVRVSLPLNLNSYLRTP